MPGENTPPSFVRAGRATERKVQLTVSKACAARLSLVVVAWKYILGYLATGKKAGPPSRDAL